MTERRADVRNVAIIAHVDHGKTTLVDAMLAQAGVFRSGRPDRPCVLDSEDQERERGITIRAKNCAVTWDRVRINLIDTPGHADFGGEVERVLRMADGCLLLVDAFEGPMPQTRFVLGKALANGLRPMVVVNKIDKPGCDLHAAVDAVFDLMVALGADDEQLDFPILYGSGRDGYMRREADGAGDDLRPLFEDIVAYLPGPPVRPDEPLQLQIANIEYNDFVGRIGVGRILAGAIRAGEDVARCKFGGATRRARVLELHRFADLAREKVDAAEAGDVVCVIGIDGIDIGDTLCDVDDPRPLPPIPIDEPTIRMTFAVTTSPLAGREGKPLQSRDLEARLRREAEANVALRVAATDEPDVFEVAGRGLLHLAVLAESLRREGFEFQVGPPRVIEREDEDGTIREPYDLAVVDVPEEHAGRVMELFLSRRGECVAHEPRGDRVHCEFRIPSRGLIGLRSRLLAATRGEAVLNTVFADYGPRAAPIGERRGGAIIAIGPGESVPFAIWNLEDRGEFFIGPNEPIYEGQVVGEHAKENDIVVNLTKGKKLTNVRSAGADDAVKLTPPRRLSLEEALEYIGSDERVELTPASIRLRKALLREVDRKRAGRER